MSDLIDREALKAAYLAAHKGEPGGAYKLICEAPACEAIDKVLASQWVPVSERLPELYDNVIAAVLTRDEYGMPAYFVTMAETRENKFEKYLTTYFPMTEGETITHWMPPPSPPKEEKC